MVAQVPTPYQEIQLYLIDDLKKEVKSLKRQAEQLESAIAKFEGWSGEEFFSHFKNVARGSSELARALLNSKAASIVERSKENNLKK